MEAIRFKLHKLVEQTRNTDHEDAFRPYHPERSHFAEHILDSGHIYDKDIEILHSCSKSKKLDLLEALEINRIKKATPGLLLNS